MIKDSIVFCIYRVYYFYCQVLSVCFIIKNKKKMLYEHYSAIKDFNWNIILYIVLQKLSIVLKRLVASWEHYVNGQRN